MPNLYSSVRGLSTAIKDVGRLREIIGVLVKHGFGAVVTRMELEDTIGVKGLMAYRDEKDQPYSLAQRLRMTVEDLGPTFVKLGQILSTRPDLVPADVIAELQSLQDAVPVVAFDAIREMVQTELGASIEERFVEFDPEPMASASIAQVHRAVVQSEDGPQEVVVKVQRPAIARAIDSDLNILQFLARQLEKQAPDLALMDPVGIVREFEKAIRRELDFSNERRNILTFETNFADFEGVSVPRVFGQRSTGRVLTMEFKRGVKITVAAETLDLDPYPIAKRMLRALFKMIFRDGVFHGDLHPGNILISDDSGIALIDFGLVGRLTRKQRENILDILIGLSRQDYQLVARVFFELGIKQPGVVYDYQAFEADVVEVMDRHLSGRTVGEVDVGAYFSDLVTGAIKHRIKMPPTYTMVFKALMTIEGIGKTLAPDLNLVEEAEPFVKEMLIERYDPQRLAKEGIDSLAELSRFTRTFPPLLTGVLRDLGEGRITLRHDLQGLDRFILVQRHANRQLTRSIAGAACILAGAITMGEPGPVVLGLPAIPTALFAIAGWLGLRAFLSSLRAP